VPPIIPITAELIPGDASSVAPKGIPVGATGAPGDMPSGEVASRPGVGLVVMPTCAKAGLQPRNIIAAAIRRLFIFIILLCVTHQRLRLPVGRGAP
jgi:hypothetical protein